MTMNHWNYTRRELEAMAATDPRAAKALEIANDAAEAMSDEGWDDDDVENSYEYQNARRVPLE
jgi:hypothetical protein